ncbi:zinc metalloprotease [Flagelloscypha sp. PMI_526]|nr:zinc metalloprotease [Flagelloscypha sp. PMI_526]
MLFPSYSLARTSTLVVCLLLCLLSNVHARSPPVRPLKRVAHPSTLALDILPRTSLDSRSLNQRGSKLLHTDSFRLTISAFGDVFHLHMSPNEHLVHPQAKIKLFNPGSSEPKVIPLKPEDVLAYMGHVVAEEDTEDRLREDAATLMHPETPNIGWARIMVHSQGGSFDGSGRPPIYSGAFTAHGTTYHVTTKDTYLRTKLENDPHPPGAVEEVDNDLVIWRDSDVHHPEPKIHGRPPAMGCGHDKLPFNSDPSLNPFLSQSPQLHDDSWFGSWGRGLANSTFSKRQDGDAAGSGMTSNFKDVIGQTSGCPKIQKLLFMGVAADCRYVAIHGDHDNATTQILTAWNSASALYKSTFNVSLGITELQVMNNTCPTKADPAFPWNVDCNAQSSNNTDITLSDRLSTFSKWRGDKGEDGNGLWHLMSGCPTGSEVGIAWLGTLCQTKAEVQGDDAVSGAGVSTAGRTEWQVIAHEIGHNFGAIHDCVDNCKDGDMCCPLNTNTCDSNSGFVMSPVAESQETKFSPCSIGNICSVMVGVDNSKTDVSCLVEASSNNKTTISLKMCGNGILEPGEECDPGRGQSSKCCDAETCTFTSGSVCDPASGQTCCTDQCQFASANTTCRPAVDSRCDQEEKCNGKNATCPPDVFTKNGQSCGSGDLKCASGQCTSVSEQCKTLGAAMGLQNVCPNRSDNTCQVSCQDPKKPNSCFVLNSLLVDGSPCGFGGSCVNGKCQAGSLLDTAVGWYQQNLQIAIPITVVAGLLAIAILFWIGRGIRNCCRSRKPSGTQRIGSYDGAASRGATLAAARGTTNWVDPAPYNGR